MNVINRAIKYNISEEMNMKKSKGSSKYVKYSVQSILLSENKNI